jgi:cysteinyl-tRNA synthetase
VLWKKSKPGEPSWDSPWGMGRPGWHIECSAMSMKKLGPEFDIHGGGADLIFPHHENEIAQSQAATGCNYAKYWVHNGFVNINDEKMSKSTGNFFTLRDILNKYQGNIIRLFLLGTHYRAPINFELAFLDEAAKSWNRIEETINQVGLIETNDQGELLRFKDGFTEAMSDDFNAAEALGHIFNLVKYCNKTNSKNAAEMIKQLLSVLGFDMEQIKTTKIPEEVESLAIKREKARENKDYQTSDQLRDQILNMGYIIKDTPKGYQLTKK